MWSLAIYCGVLMLAFAALFLEACSLIFAGFYMITAADAVLVGSTLSGTVTTFGTLVVDLNQASPTAAMNVRRCLLGTAGMAAVQPMLGAMGQGWTTTLSVGLWVGSLAIVQRGTKRRAETKAKEEKKMDVTEENKRRKRITLLL